MNDELKNSWHAGYRELTVSKREIVKDLRQDWLSGKWDGLANLASSSFDFNSDGMEIAAYAASACIQLNDRESAVGLLKKAFDLGERKTVFSILMAGVYVSIGKSFCLDGRPGYAIPYFKTAALIVSSTKEEYRLALEKVRLQIFDANYFFFHGKRLDFNLSNPWVGFNLAGKNQIFDFSIISELNEESITRGDGLVKLSSFIKEGVCGGGGFDLVCTTLNCAEKKFIFAHVKGDYIPKKIATEAKFYEIVFLEFLSRFYVPDSLILDVGANIGNHTIYFSGVLGADVAAFEPEPHNLACLATNVLINGVRDKVDIYGCALGKEDDLVNISMSISDNFGSFSSNPQININRTDVSSEMQAVVIVRNLDSYQFEKKISVIKIDVEGMESDVLRGACELIKSNLPVIAVECLNIDMFREVEAELSVFGYFPVELLNATPTFVFVSRNNHVHMDLFLQSLRKLSINKAMRKNGFSEGNVDV